MLDAQPVSNVLHHGHVREESVGLKNHRGVSVLRRNVVDSLTVDVDTSGSRVFETRKNPQGCRLATAGWAKQRHEIATIHGKGEVVYGSNLFLGSFREDLDKILESYDSVSHASFTLLVGGPVRL